MLHNQNKEAMDQQNNHELSSTESCALDQNWVPLLPLKNVVVLPKTIQPVIVGRTNSIKAVENALKHDKLIFVTAQKSPETEHPTQDDVYQVGTKATILQVMRLPNGALKILLEGTGRARISQMRTGAEFDEVQYTTIQTTNLKHSVQIEAAWRQLQKLYQSYVKLNDRIPTDLLAMVRTINDMENVVDTIAIHINLAFDERQEILEMVDFEQRLLRVTVLLKRENEILETEVRIKGHVQTQVEKNQKEYYLNEQIKAIQKELGREDTHSEIAKLRATVESLNLPAEAREKAEKELKRLEQMPPLSSEAVVSRHFVDWIISIPWDKKSKDTVSLRQAEKFLNKDHAGLTKAKDRIIEFLAAKKYSGSQEKAPIICLVGPPGVGKTSLAKSIAQSTGRELVRISLGGVKDEAEIRGHRRTYIGALPGKIIQSMKKAKYINPVILLDEIDKMASDFHGDPAAALLEVLDPEQNKNFVDHFLDIEYDLSNVMFITTANTFEGIPYPLLDRMEIIHLEGYSEEEKYIIAQKFLIPKKLAEYGLTKSQFKINNDILRVLINDYTKEAGVRQLERTIAKLMRKTIQMFLKDRKQKKVDITLELINEWLGYPKFKKSPLDLLSNRTGIATGLAWTELGGDILEVEGTVIPGKGALTLTGQLGDVMQESAQAALSYIRSRSKELGLSNSLFSNRDIHLHMPEGATPKDGPSAGVTMCISMISALTKNPIKPAIAMTGEITLRGRVLPVGGLKEKILAARRYGMKTVIVPKENTDEIDEIRKEIPTIDEHLQLIFAEHMDDILNNVLEKKPFEQKKQKRSAKATKRRTPARARKTV